MHAIADSGVRDIRLLRQARPEQAPALVLHAASSTTNTERYCNLFEAVVLPYWQADPPRFRLTSKPYKSVYSKNACLPEHSLTFKVQNFRHIYLFLMPMTVIS